MSNKHKLNPATFPDSANLAESSAANPVFRCCIPASDKDNADQII